MIDLLTTRSRLVDLLEELAGFPGWTTQRGREVLVDWYLQMGWIMTWEAQWILRAGRKVRAA